MHTNSCPHHIVTFSLCEGSTEVYLDFQNPENMLLAYVP